MKKIVFILAAIFVFISCEKDENTLPTLDPESYLNPNFKDSIITYRANEFKATNDSLPAPPSPVCSGFYVLTIQEYLKVFVRNSYGTSVPTYESSVAPWIGINFNDNGINYSGTANLESWSLSNPYEITDNQYVRIERYTCFAWYYGIGCPS